MFYRFLDSAIGKLMLVKNNQNLISIFFEKQGFDNVFAKYSLTIKQENLPSDFFNKEEKQIKDFLNGDIKSFSLLTKLEIENDFRRRVLNFLPKIEYGKTKSYKDIAIKLNNKNAFRAVGSACANNPLPLIYPCHRVLKSDGSIGEYAGGVDAKNYLLKLEAN